MSWAHSTHRKDEKCTQILSENLKVGPKCRVRDIKTNLIENGSNGVEWMDLAHDRNHALPLGSIKFKKFLDLLKNY
jgi:hypothetical protein